MKSFKISVIPGIFNNEITEYDVNLMVKYHDNDDNQNANQKHYLSIDAEIINTKNKEYVQIHSISIEPSYFMVTLDQVLIPEGGNIKSHIVDKMLELKLISLINKSNNKFKKKFYNYKRDEYYKIYSINIDKLHEYADFEIPKDLHKHVSILNIDTTHYEVNYGKVYKGQLFNNLSDCLKTVSFIDNVKDIVFETMQFKFEEIKNTSILRYLKLNDNEIVNTTCGYYDYANDLMAVIMQMPNISKNTYYIFDYNRESNTYTLLFNVNLI